MSAFFCKNQRFLSKNVPLLKAIVWELCLRFLSSVLSFCKTKGYCYWKHNFCRLRTFATGIRPPVCSKLARNPKNDNDVTVFRHDVNVKFFDVVLFLLSILVTGPSFMSISSLVLELWQFSFIRDWPEIRKLEIPPSEFCPIPGDQGNLWVPNLALMSLIGYYWMLQNSKVTAFTVLELLRENQLRGKITHPFFS